MASRAAWQLSLTRYLVRPLEAVALAVVHALLNALPVDAASAIGGFVARSIGPRLGLSRRARKSMKRAFPEHDDATIKRLVREMWDNLGRLAAEVPHVAHLKVFESGSVSGGSRVEAIGREHIDTALALGKPIIFFTGHIGNWEVAPLVGVHCGVPLHVTYRSANNKWADQLIAAGRRDMVHSLIPKGADGARMAIKVLERGQALGMLVDQKMNDGIAVPFLGRPAMTAPGLAQLARRFDCIVIPLWVERLGGARFKVRVEPPLPVPNTGDRHADNLAMMTLVNARIEAWVRQCPGQWFWLHKRWPD